MTQIETIAEPGTVTEHAWERITNSADRRGRRTNRPEATYETTTYRVWHADPACARLVDLRADGSTGRIVGRYVDVRDESAGLPCDVCSTRQITGSADPSEVAAEADERRRTDRRPGSGSGRGTPVADGPTEKQVSYLRSLYRDLGLGEEFVEQVREAAETSAQGWTKRSVSKLIDGAKDAVEAQRREQASSPAPAAPSPSPASGEVARVGTRPNRYEGSCRLCGASVAADGGGLLGKLNGRWVVEHRPGECSTAPVAAPAAPAPAPLADVPAGHYAIASTGANDLAFYRVDRPTEGAYAGRTFVKLIVGGHPDSNVRYAAVPGILDRIVEAGIAESATLYGREIGQCYRCNRSLTDETSRSLGIGPECRKKG